jgi:hypothetical protein
MPQVRMMTPVGMDDRIFAVATIHASHRPRARMLVKVRGGPVEHKKTAATYACHGSSSFPTSFVVFPVNQESINLRD